ncbi:MAG: hypothetical protein ACXWKP_26905 [Bradyrhizobium sp.]
MRTTPAASAAAKPVSLSTSGRSESPTELVCAALVLALVVLGCRIASVWW